MNSNETEDMRRAARKNPNGWIYKTEGEFGADEHVPPEAIVGAWKVDANGSLTGEFIQNPKYKPGHSKAGNLNKG